MLERVGMKSLFLERKIYPRLALYVILGSFTVMCIDCSEQDKFMAPRPPYPEIDRFPVWSPDGARVIYYHAGITEIHEGGAYHVDYNQQGIWMVDITGDNPHLIIQGATYADYSDDGEWLAYELGRNVYTVRISGDQIDYAMIKQLTFEGENFFPSWSRDGMWIAYDSDVQEIPREFAIWKMRSDGTSKTMLCEGRAADWAPAEDRIVAWRKTPSGLCEIVTFDYSGNNLVQVTSDERWNKYPRYSPDGEKIAYCSCYDHPYAKIKMMNADGTGVVTVIDWAFVYRPSWSPRGDRILYTRYDWDNYCKNGTVWITSINGRKMIQLTRGISPE